MQTFVAQPGSRSSGGFRASAPGLRPARGGGASAASRHRAGPARRRTRCACARLRRWARISAAANMIPAMPPISSERQRGSRELIDKRGTPSLTAAETSPLATSSPPAANGAADSMRCINDAVAPQRWFETLDQRLLLRRLAQFPYRMKRSAPFTFPDDGPRLPGSHAWKQLQLGLAGRIHVQPPLPAHDRADGLHGAANCRWLDPNLRRGTQASVREQQGAHAAEMNSVHAASPALRRVHTSSKIHPYQASEIRGSS